MDRTVLHVESDNATALSSLHQKVKGEVLDEVVAVVRETLAVECVQQRVTCAISNTATPEGGRDIGRGLIKLSNKGQFQLVMKHLHDVKRFNRM